MHGAVDGMVVEYRTAYYSYILGIIFIHLWAILFSWLIYVHWVVSALATGVCVLSLWALSRYARRVTNRFRMPNARDVNTGRFDGGEEVHSAAAQAAGALGQKLDKRAGGRATDVLAQFKEGAMMFPGQ
jgi:Flp pilus assembly protein TadB